MRKTTQPFFLPILFLLILFAAIACNDNPTNLKPVDPDKAPVVSIDRFSDDAGTLFQRSFNPELPEPNEPINFDQVPFLKTGLGPDGDIFHYYNFDVMTSDPAPIYVFFREGKKAPVEGQLNIIDVIPGQPGYNDFWQVYRVTVPNNYEANTVTSLNGINAGGYQIEPMDRIVNCPVVPEGSTAKKRLHSSEDNSPDQGWYRGLAVHYFTFSEKPLTVNSNGEVPTSQIYVSFNINPGQEGGEPPSGFKTEDGYMKTHNVPAALPYDDGYSPLLSLNIYDNADFNRISDLMTARNANILVEDAALANFPIASVE